MRNLEALSDFVQPERAIVSITVLELAPRLEARLHLGTTSSL